MTIVALVGATGNFGYKLLPVLVADKRITKVHSLSRSLPKDAGSSKVVHFKVDYTDPKSLENALKGCDVLLNAMGTNADYERNKVTLVDVAAKVEVKIYIPRCEQPIHTVADGAVSLESTPMSIQSSSDIRCGKARRRMTHTRNRKV